MAAERGHELNHWLNGRGGLLLEHFHSLNSAITLVLLIQFPYLYDFPESLESDLSNDVFKSKIW